MSANHPEERTKESYFGTDSAGQKVTYVAIMTSAEKAVFHRTLRMLNQAAELFEPDAKIGMTAVPDATMLHAALQESGAAFFRTTEAAPVPAQDSIGSVNAPVMESSFL